MKGSALPPIKINPANEGTFTASAKRAGEGVQEHAHEVMSNANASPKEKKRANFAIQARKWSRKRAEGQS